jgi:tetratricopeptide (TPR) repeat protein
VTNLLKKLFLSVLLLLFAATLAVTEDESAIKTLLNTGISHYNQGSYDLALNDLREVIDSKAASDDGKARAQIFIGRCYLKREKYEEALKEFERVRVSFPAADRHLKAESLLEIVEAFGMLKMPGKAIEACETVLREYGDVSKELLWKASASKAHFLNARGQPAKALEAYRECLNYHASLPRWYAVQGFLRFANQLKLLGKKEQAAHYYFKVLNEYEDSWHPWGRTCLISIIDCTVSEGLLKKTVTRCTDIICASPETRTIAQESIVNILLKLGDYRKALSHAKMYFDVCSFSEMKNGLDYLLVSLKGADRNSVRVNQLLHFLRFGIKGFDGIGGTRDDVSDPLQAIDYVKEPDRETKILSAIKDTPLNTEGSLARSEFYLLINDRHSALRELRNAYLACPVEQAQLQKVTDRITKLLFLVHGEIEAGEQFVKHQQYGQNGEDGTAATAPVEERKNACLFAVKYARVSMIDFQFDLSTKLAGIYFAETEELVEAGKIEGARERLLQVLVRLPEKAVRRQAAERIFATFDTAPPRESPHSVFAARSWVHLKKDKKIEELIDYYGAQYLYRQRQFEDAEKLINEVLPLYRGTEIGVDFAFLMALCHVKMGNYDLGEEELLQIVKTYPEFEDRTKARFLIGWMAMMEQDYSKAKKTFESIVHDSPGDTYTEHAKDFLRRIPEPT